MNNIFSIINVTYFSLLLTFSVSRNMGDFEQSFSLGGIKTHDFFSALTDGGIRPVWTDSLFET